MGTLVRQPPQRLPRLAAAFLASAALAVASCSRSPERPPDRTFSAPEDAVKALNAAVAKGSLAEIVAIFGPEGQGVIDSSDPVTVRRNRQVFTAAVAEGWRLQDEDGRKVLVIGNEAWPFPVPLVKDGAGWRFDVAAGKEEILARRIGRNELAAIRIARAYVTAQQLYARQGHDGGPAGAYAQTFRSDPGRQNGLYWPARPGEPRSPLGELAADAAQADRVPPASAKGPSPFQGYFFRILTRQGAAAPGGARDYVVDGAMTRGFGLVAWPAQYGVTGIMTFIVNHEGVLHEKDLGSGTSAAAAGMSSFNPDPSWSVVE